MKKLLLIGFISFITFSASHAQSTRTISVTGEAIVYATPEIAKVNIPLSAKNSDYTACSNQLLSTYDALSKALVKVGFKKEEIKSTRFNITESYVYRERERVKDGYVGSMGLVLKMEQNPENMGKLVKVMSQESFSFGYSIQYDLSEKQKAELEKKAIQQAVAQATSNAKLLMAAAEQKLGYLYNITYGNSTPTYSPLVRADGVEMMKSDGQALEITPNEMEIRKHVDMTWSIMSLSEPDPRK